LLLYVGSPAFGTSNPVGYVVAISGFLVWLSSFNAGYILPAWAVPKVFTWVGARSYAIYLIHVPVFFFVRELLSRTSSDQLPSLAIGASLVLAPVMIAVLAELNYRFIECPLREVGRRQAASFARAKIKDPSVAVGSNV